MIVTPHELDMKVEKDMSFTHRFIRFIRELTSRTNVLHKDRIVRITSSDSPYTVPDEVDTVFADTTGGAITINLPPAADSVGRKIMVARESATSNHITTDPDGSELIGGAATKNINAQYDNDLYFCNGVEWFINGA